MSTRFKYVLTKKNHSIVKHRIIDSVEVVGTTVNLFTKELYSNNKIKMINGWKIKQIKSEYEKTRTMQSILADVIKECKDICQKNPDAFPKMEELIEELNNRKKGKRWKRKEIE